MDACSRAMARIRRGYSSFDFDDIDLSATQDVHQLVALLRQSQQNPAVPLAAVSFVSCQLSPAGATMIAEWAANTPSLVEISLSKNRCLGDESGAAAEAVADAVVHLPALERLWLSYTGLGDKGASVLARACHFSCSLRVLGLEGNQDILGQGVQAIAIAVGKSCSITEVFLAPRAVKGPKARTSNARLPQTQIRKYCDRNEVALASLASRQRLCWALAGLSPEATAANLSWDLLETVANLQQLCVRGQSKVDTGSSRLSLGRNDRLSVIAAEVAAVTLRQRWCREGTESGSEYQNRLSGRSTGVIIATACEAHMLGNSVGVSAGEWHQHQRRLSREQAAVSKQRYGQHSKEYDGNKEPTPINLGSDLLDWVAEQQRGE